MTQTERPTAPAKAEPDANAPLVLVVEDNETNARLALTVLRACGYRTAIANDGTEGLRLGRELRPDVILADLQMPGMNGLELTRALKAEPDTASIPIIALTAHAMEDHRRQALEAGCVKFLTKPFRFQELQKEVSDVIGNHAISQS